MYTYNECVCKLHSTFFNCSIGSQMSLNGQLTRCRQFSDNRFGTRSFCTVLNKIKNRFFLYKNSLSRVTKSTKITVTHMG